MIRKILTGSGIAAVSAAAAGVIAFLCVWYVLPAFEPDPMQLLREETPVRVWTDGAGRPVHVERTWEGQWRFEVELSRISPAVIRTILAVEDRNFYSHHGVDFQALMRAFSQNLLHGRIVSGASTITMQLAGMTEPGKRRSYLRKLRQIIKARRLEQLYSKDVILTEYLNRLPFGGKIYGIEAAAQYYFGQHASALNRSEAALLCGLPQRPNAYRPDRFPKLAAERRDRVLKQLVHLQEITEPDRIRIREKERLRFRDYGFPAEFQLLERTEDRMYFELAAREANDAFRIACAYHPEAARLLRHTLIRQCAALPGVQDAAGVLIDNPTGRIIALTGTITSENSPGGQVNAATAVRSAGSSLKPFLYAEAVSGGCLTADTILKDLPLRYGGYAPGNSDGGFRGEVRAAEALADSLNTPAIRIAEELGTARIDELFRKLRLIRQGYRRYDGLSIALGTAGHTLLDITAAYRVFTRNGKWSRPTFLLDPGPRPETAVFAEGTGEMIERMLLRPLPGTNCSAAWKTGTSNGNRDAWCFAFTPDYTLGIWFGNKSGKAAAALTGLHAAAPAAGIVMSSLAGSGSGKVTPGFPNSFRHDRLCRVSGLHAGPDCKETFTGYSLKAALLRPCQSCTPGKMTAIRILNPAAEKYLTGADGSVELRIVADSRTVPHWMLNGSYLGSFREKLRNFTTGKYTLSAMSENADERSAAVHFEVIRQAPAPAAGGT